MRRSQSSLFVCCGLFALAYIAVIYRLKGSITLAPRPPSHPKPLPRPLIAAHVLPPAHLTAAAPQSPPQLPPASAPRKRASVPSISKQKTIARPSLKRKVVTAKPAPVHALAAQPSLQAELARATFEVSSQVLVALCKHDLLKPNSIQKGVFGEYKIWTTIMWALQALSVEVIVIESTADLLKFQAARRKNPEKEVVVVSDEWTQTSLIKQLIKRRDRRYNVDFWGTPAQQVSPGTTSSQYLTPYPYNVGNTFIGFRAQSANAKRRPTKKPIVLVAGKEAKYFTKPVREMLAAVAHLKGVRQVVTTIQDFTSLGGPLADGIENFGLLNPTAYELLLSQAAVVLGVGDPVLGPNVLDALEHGCVVIQIRYNKARVDSWVNPRIPWVTQHDYAHNAVGEPWVVSTSLKDYPQAVQRAIELQKQSPTAQSRLPEAFTDVAIKDRVRIWLESAITSTKS